MERMIRNYGRLLVGKECDRSCVHVGIRIPLAIADIFGVVNALVLVGGSICGAPSNESSADNARRLLKFLADSEAILEVDLFAILCVAKSCCQYQAGGCQSNGIIG